MPDVESGVTPFSYYLQKDSLACSLSFRDLAMRPYSVLAISLLFAAKLFRSTLQPRSRHSDISEVLQFRFLHTVRA